MNAQERLAYLLETEETPTNTLVTIGMIRDALPLEAYGLVLGTFAQAKIPQSANPLAIVQAAEMESAFIAMSGAGLSLSSQSRQETIDVLAAAGQWPDSVRDVVKALGVRRRPRWQSEGYETEPTIEQITKELIIAATRETMAAQLQPIQAKSTAINAWLDAVKLADYTEAELQEYCDSLLASADGNPAGGE